MEKKELSDEEKKLLKQYSENNTYLYEALSSCWKNGIRTHACCAGHNKTMVPYLAILIDDKSVPYIKKIIAGLQDVKDISMNIGIRHNGIDDVVYPNSECRSLAIYGQISNRCELFYTIGQAIENDENIEIHNPKAKIFWNSVEKFNDMPYDEMLYCVKEKLVLGSGFSNISQQLIKYKEGNRLSERIKRYPFIRKLLEVFSPKIKNDNEEYNLLENKYEEMQNYYQPTIPKDISKPVSVKPIKAEANLKSPQICRDER